MLFSQNRASCDLVPTSVCIFELTCWSKTFAAVLLQPNDDDASIAAMCREVAGGPWKFMTDGLTHFCSWLITFASKAAQGYGSKLHSHLREGFAGNWAINKFHCQLKGQPFTCITYCYAKSSFCLTTDLMPWSYVYIYLINVMDYVYHSSRQQMANWCRILLLLWQGFVL